MGGDRAVKAILSERFGWIGWLSALSVALVAFAVGFVWLPSAPASTSSVNWLDAICRAAGISGLKGLGQRSDSYATVPTSVAWDTQTLRAAASGDGPRAAAIALGCASCHGARGVSPSEAFPNLAGMSTEVIYKAFDDYRSGKRQNPTMEGIARALSAHQVSDLAAYYAALPARPSARVDAPPPLIATGDPGRAIAACAACHGPAGRKEGAPPLVGQKRQYLKAQLDAFSADTRENDMNRQMRQIARAMTEAERQSIADWYARQDLE